MAKLQLDQLIIGDIVNNPSIGLDEWQIDPNNNDLGPMEAIAKLRAIASRRSEIQAPDTLTLLSMDEESIHKAWPAYRAFITRTKTGGGLRAVIRFSSKWAMIFHP